MAQKSHAILFDHTWLKDYLNRSTIVRQLICVFLTCSLNLCSNMTCFANLCSNMTRTSGAHLPAEVALAAVSLPARGTASALV